MKDMIISIAVGSAAALIYWVSPDVVQSLVGGCAVLFTVATLLQHLIEGKK